MSLLLTEFTKTLQNEILLVQHTTHNAEILFYKLTCRFIYFNIPFNRRECFWLTDSWTTLYSAWKNTYWTVSRKFWQLLGSKKNFHLIHIDKIMQDAPTLFQEMTNLEYRNPRHIFTMHVSSMHWATRRSPIIRKYESRHIKIWKYLLIAHLYTFIFYHAERDSHSELLTMDTEYFLLKYATCNNTTHITPLLLCMRFKQFLFSFSILIPESN
jgi:hypothetical protein